MYIYNLTVEITHDIDKWIQRAHMVFMLAGNSEIGASLRSEIIYLIFKGICQDGQQIYSRQRPESRAQRVLRYHII